MNLFETDILYICAYITCQICLIYENVYLIIKGIIRTLINDNTMSMSNQKEMYLWAIHLCYKKKKCYNFESFSWKSTQKYCDY